MDEWIQNSGSACYNTSTPGFALSQNGILEIDQLYLIEFSISNMTQGKLILQSIEGQPEYTEDGDYSIVGKALSLNLTFIGDEKDGDTFDGCIDSVSARLIPFITIKDLEGNIVFEQTDDTGITASGTNIQYQINWEDIEDGCYKIYISDSGLDYESDCLSLQLTHDCSLLLSWTNNDNAFGFNYDDLGFTPNLRVNARLWQPKYSKEKIIFKDSSGTRTLLKSETSKDQLLTVSEAPEYIHDALSIGLEHDNFYVESIKYTNEETEYTPKWRKSSQLAPVEIIIIKDQNLKNDNC